MEEQTKLRPRGIAMSDESYEALKIACVKRKVKIQDAVKLAVEDWLKVQPTKK